MSDRDAAFEEAKNKPVVVARDALSQALRRYLHAANPNADLEVADQLAVAFGNFAVAIGHDATLGFISAAQMYAKTGSITALETDGKRDE